MSETIVSQDVERQTVVDNGVVSQVRQDLMEQVVIENDITLLVEQVTQEQVAVETQVTVQVSQETQEQVVLGVPGSIGPAGINWHGAYDSMVDYATHDAVSYNGNAYLCILACSGIVPTETLNWSTLVEGMAWNTLDLGSYS